MNVANILSLARFPLSFLLLGSPQIALTAISTACLTDMLDGWVARKYGMQSRLGAILDPLSDKFFAFFGLSCLYLNEKITLVQASSFLAREMALVLFTLYLCISRRLRNHEIKAFLSGKVMTSLQFIAFIILFGGWNLSSYFYQLFWLLGITSLIELFTREAVELNP